MLTINDMKQITLDERKKILLDMLSEFQDFCIDNELKYSLAFGTLLGAIRHKGYIPWDDDVDISMPLEDIHKLKQIFHSDNLKISDNDSEPYYQQVFPRISHNQSFMKRGLIVKSYGINIDLYPLIEVSNSDEEIERIHQLALPLIARKRHLQTLRSRLIRFFPIKNIPGYVPACNAYRDLMLKELPCPGSGRFFFVAGRWALFYKHVVDFNPFDELIDVDIEDRKFLAPARYDEILHTRYGDYMQLPPEDERHPYHGGTYYWR